MANSRVGATMSTETVDCFFDLGGNWMRRESAGMPNAKVFPL
jgi:hypothetical protein